MHHRIYDPKTATFTSADPAEDDSNLYRYGRNNPVNKDDPSGLQDPTVNTQGESAATIVGFQDPPFNRNMPTQTNGTILLQPPPGGWPTQNYPMELEANAPLDSYRSTSTREVLSGRGLFSYSYSGRNLQPSSKSHIFVTSEPLWVHFGFQNKQADSGDIGKSLNFLQIARIINWKKSEDISKGSFDFFPKNEKSYSDFLSKDRQMWRIGRISDEATGWFVNTRGNREDPLYPTASDYFNDARVSIMDRPEIQNNLDAARYFLDYITYVGYTEYRKNDAVNIDEVRKKLGLPPAAKPNIDENTFYVIGAIRWNILIQRNFYFTQPVFVENPDIRIGESALNRFNDEWRSKWKIVDE